MEGGLSVMGDRQCSYTGTVNVLTPGSAPRVLYEFLQDNKQLTMSFLSKGSSSTLNSHDSIGTYETRNSQPLAPKTIAVSIEITWLLNDKKGIYE